MKIIRYSQAFKQEVVREVESGDRSAHQVQRKHGIRSHNTVMRWVRELGSGKYGNVIRVERAGEVGETTRLRRQLRQAKEALADAHMELSLERAYLAAACERMEQRVEDFKKKHDGLRRTGRGKSNRS